MGLDINVLFLLYPKRQQPPGSKAQPLNRCCGFSFFSLFPFRGHRLRLHVSHNSLYMRSTQQVDGRRIATVTNSVWLCTCAILQSVVWFGVFNSMPTLARMGSCNPHYTCLCVMARHRRFKEAQSNRIVEYHGATLHKTH